MRLENILKRAAAALGTAGIATLVATGPVGAAVIDFGELAVSGSDAQSFASISSGGFDFVSSVASSGSYLVWGTTNPFNADPGGATLSHNFPGTTTVMTKADGGTFSLLSIDFGDVYNQPFNVQTIQIVGTRADQSTVTETVTTDALAGLESFLFTDLTDLVSVAWTPISATTNAFLQFDNVVVDEISVPVPEPMTLTLLVGGLAALAGLRRRRSRAV
jgi:hypothetical protein